MHNSGLGLALILNQFDGLGGAALVAAGWGVWHLVSGWALAAWWKRRDPVAGRAARGRMSDAGQGGVLVTGAAGFIGTR